MSSFLKSSELESDTYSQAFTILSKAQLEVIFSNEFQWSEIVTFTKALTREMTAGVFDYEPTLNRLREGNIPTSSTEISEVLELIKGAEAQLSKLDEFAGQIQKKQDEWKMCVETTPGLVSSVPHLPEDGAALAAVQYDDLEQSRSKLIDAGDELKRFIRVMTTFISSPARHLPEDILLEIFMMYITSGEFRYRKLGRKEVYSKQSRPYSLAMVPKRRLVHCPTLRLSQICSFWRRVVLSQPSLWQSLAIQLDDFADNHLELLSHHLLHSANLPLTLLINSWKVLKKTEYRSQCHPSMQAFNLLLDHSSRWKEVILDLGPVLLVPQFLSMVLLRGTGFSNMRHLDLRFTISRKKKGRIRYKEFLQFLVHMPNLPTLTGARFDWGILSQCDLSKLIELRSVNFHGTSLGLFLSRMPGLKECHLEEFRFLSGTLLQGDCRSNLSTLSLNLDGFLDYGPGVWKNLFIPHLKTLHLLGRGGLRSRWSEHNSIIIADLSSMILSSRATLQRLELQGVPSQDAIMFIKSHPSVADLTISGGFLEHNYWEKYGALFTCLTVTEKEQTIDSVRSQVIGPCISNLTLRLDFFIETNQSTTTFVEDVYNLVESRASLIPGSSNMARLDVVKLQLSRSAIYTRLAPLEESGLTLLVFYDVEF
ncbi:hypothetical protein BDP27DRAFT_1460970 [Rhodocollybia butyracea]|uniref:F-box domain-containing protein n=1 Tax=Rhodocollybia butyracea TaxID=206335 RepID=A0A9P5PZ47_9AGAR|nr:hypothetical protein BDP27DRAFT_1460970 [Rhodocollybia butyracea]